MTALRSMPPENETLFDGIHQDHQRIVSDLPKFLRDYEKISLQLQLVSDQSISKDEMILSLKEKLNAALNEIASLNEEIEFLISR